MASWLAQQAGKVIGNVGSSIDYWGKKLNNPAPEKNVSETLQRVGSYLNPVKTVSAYEPSYDYSQSKSVYTPQPTVLGTQKSNVGGGGGGDTGGSQGFYSQGMQNIQSQGDQGMDFIEQDYNNALGMLAGQEQSLRGQAGTAEGQIESEAGQVRTQLEKEQGTAETGVQSNLQTAETQGASQLQQARDLFRQTQQQNIAQLSALGISSSSVAEALAERLGVETARRIAGVTGSLSEVRINATKELSRIKDYFQSKLTDVQNQVQVQKSNIQNALMQGLNQINAARNQAAADKARSRAELLNNVQNSIYQLTQQQQQFEQSLKQWAEQKSAALTPIVTDPNFVNTLTQATNTFNQQFAPSGFQYVPQVSTNPYGNVTGSVKYNLQKNTEDELTNPFAG